MGEVMYDQEKENQQYKMNEVTGAFTSENTSIKEHDLIKNNVCECPVSHALSVQAKK